MDILWAPWRMEYILSDKSKCVFCKSLKEKKDKKNLILYQGEHCFIVLNKYPYTHGHLMIAPLRHVAKFENLKNQEKLEMFNLIQRSIAILKKGLKAQGFNMGMNIGKVAGAGVLGHIHLHLVPRWEGDTNFMPMLGKTKVISEDLKKTFQKLSKPFKQK